MTWGRRLAVLGLLQALLALRVPPIEAKNSTLGVDDDTGCTATAANADVPAGVADLVTNAFVGQQVGMYAPFLSGCSNFTSQVMEACTGPLEGDPEGQRWVLDAAANCTQGKWNNGVSTIIVRGDVAVDGASGNLTVLSTALGTEIKVLEEGDGDYPPPGFNITADYTLWLANGTWIESTVGGEPLSIELGSGHLIRAWDEGLQLMRVGETAMLVARPISAYGERRDEDPIAPNSTLVFQITLLSSEGLEP